MKTYRELIVWKKAMKLVTQTCRRFLCLCAFVPLCLCAFSSSSPAAPGKAGGVFLRMIQSPRAVGVGEAGTALGGDLLGSVILNPATLALFDYKEAAFVYNVWFEDISIQQLAYAHPTQKRGVLAGSLSMLQIKPFQGYDNSGNKAGDVKAGDICASVSYGKRIFGEWSDMRRGFFAGGAVKYARETLDTVSAGALLADFGILGIAPLGPGLAGVGISASSLGQGYKFDSDRDPAPTIYRAGVSYSAKLFGDPIAAVFDVRKPSDDGMLFSGGLEYVLKRIIAWRAGYVSGQDVGSGLRFGAGFNLKLFKIDYALARFGKFGLAHRFAVAIKFGAPIEITPHLTPGQEKAKWHVENAKVMMKRQSYYETVLELDKALTLDPASKEAIALMRKARNLLDTQR